MMKPFPTLGQVYSLLVQEEKQRQVKSGGIFQTESASFSAETSQISGQSSGRLLQARKQEGGKPRPYCSHYKRQGHTMETCYKIHGYPNRQGGKNKNYRGANGAWGEQESQTDQLSSTPILPGLNQEQSKQLFQFLTNLTGAETKGARSCICSTSGRYYASSKCCIFFMYSTSRSLDPRQWSKRAYELRTDIIA